MCNLYSITTNQEAIIRLFRKVNRHVGNLAPMPGVFPDYPAPVIRSTDEGEGRELVMMRWGMPPPPRTGKTRPQPHEVRRASALRRSRERPRAASSRSPARLSREPCQGTILRPAH
jgi:putative SOS response-associated peptidase YedK